MGQDTAAGQDTDNVRGHRARLEHLLKSRSRDEAMRLYVGGGNEFWIGHREKEAIARYADLADAAVVDIGCGIGRLTRHLIDEPIASYLGTDVVPEVIAEARQLAAGDARFRFELVDSITIPTEEDTADVVCGFSVITHLLDREVFLYFEEAKRVLRSGGIAVFSFVDYALEREMFIKHVRDDSRRDLLTFFEKDTLRFFADASGLEVIEFQDAGAPAPAKYPGQVPGFGETFPLGQSIAYLRA